MLRNNPLEAMHITSPYGVRIHPVSRAKSFHNGIDLRAPMRTPIAAVARGRVVVSKANNGGPTVGLGWYIVVEHDTFCTVSAHMYGVGLNVGHHVREGDIIGYTGNSGVSTAPHLHWEMRAGKYTPTFWQKDKAGKYLNAIDPTQYILGDDPIENLVNAVRSKGILSDVNYWTQVIKREREVNPDFIKIIFENIARL
jgi:murein DD-endopeptidase MepM/ murein hydrolase activator NlpD